MRITKYLNDFEMFTRQRQCAAAIDAVQMPMVNLWAQFYLQEISFDVFLQVIWEDKRVHHRNNSIDQKYIELKLEERHKLWVSYVIGGNAHEICSIQRINKTQRISSVSLFKAV